MLLSAADLRWFVERVQRDHPLAYEDEFDVPATGRAGGTPSALDELRCHRRAAKRTTAVTASGLYVTANGGARGLCARCAHRKCAKRAFASGERLRETIRADGASPSRCPSPNAANCEGH